MSYEGQAPPPSGFPDNGNQQAPQGVNGNGPGGQAPQAAYGQPAPYQQPGQQAPAPTGYGQQAPAPGGYGQQGYAAQPNGPGQHAPAQGSAPQAAAAPRPNPFAGIPVSDFVRDGVAALLLLVSFTLPVTTGSRGLEGVGDRFHFIVTLVTVLSLLSLTLPYLARANVFPPSWTVHTTRLVRLLANAPYAVVVLVYVVLDALTSDETTGVGTIFALGLAGAVLAAQPRQCEMGPEDLDRGVSRLWWSITAGIGGFIALTYVVSLIIFLIDVGDFADYYTTTAVFGAILAWIFAVVFTLWAIYGTVIQRSQAWRLVLIGLGVILVCAFVFGAGEDSSLLKVESLRAIGFSIIQPLSLQEGLGAVFLPAAAAAAAAPATVRSLKAEPRSRSWIFAAVHGLEYIAVVAAATVLTAALWFFFEDIERPTGVLVTTIILGLLILGAAVYGRMALAKDPAVGRVPALAAAGASFVLGLVILIMVPSETIFTGDKYVTVGHLALAFGLPALVAIALTAPKAVREYFATNRRTPQAATGSAYQWSAPAAPAPGYQYPGQSGDQAAQGGTAPAQQPYGAPAQAGSWQTQGAVQPQYGQQGQQAQQDQHVEHSPAPGDTYPEASGNAAETVKLAKTDEPTDSQAPAVDHGTAAEGSAPVSSGFTAAQALDPATPGAVLAQIVQDAPELRAQVAANPSTYPALLGWLGQLGDPEIDAALRNRQS